VTRHGENAVVIVAYRDFVGAEPAQNFKDFNARPYRAKSWTSNQIEPQREGPSVRGVLAPYGQHALGRPMKH
jgi:hypothetical protein